MTASTLPSAQRSGTLADVPLRAPWTSRRALLLIVSCGTLALCLWAVRRTEVSLFELIDGWPQTQNLLERMWPPRIPREDIGVITRSVLDTFFMAFAGTAIAVFLAVPLALCASRTTMPFAPVRAVARGIIVFTRAVPSIVLALVFVRVYGIGVLPGILAIGIHAVGMIGKLLTDAADDIDPGPRDGVLSTGASPSQDMLTGVWSQMVPTAIAVSLYRLEIDFRGATLLGFVGGGGIGLQLKAYQGNLRYPELLGVTLLIVALVILVEFGSNMTRRAILGESTGGKPMVQHGRVLDTLSVSRSATNRSATNRSATNRSATSDTAGGSVSAFGPSGRCETLDDIPLSPPWTADRRRLAIASLGATVLFFLSFIVPDISMTEMVTSMPEIPRIFWRLVPKDMTWLTDNLVQDMIETIAIGFAATFLALLAGIPFAFLAASNTSPGRWIYRGSRLFMLLLRSAPELVVAVIFVAALGLGPTAGTLALAIGVFGFVTKLLADAIEEVRQGPRDGVVATGAGRVQEIGASVTPQFLPALLGNMLYVLDVSLRSSTVVGIVGGGGIGFLLNNAAKTLKFEVIGGIIITIFVVVYAIELLANWVRKQVI